MDSSNSFSLQEYRIQRQYREQRRKEYLRQFQVLRQKVNNLQGQPAKQIATKKSYENVVANTQKVAKPKKNQQASEQQQNRILKQKLGQLQAQQRQKLQKYKQQIAVAKQQYITNVQKSQGLQRVQKLQQQIKAATVKNKEIQDFNKKIQEQSTKAFQVMEKYSTQIKNQYDQKLQQFNNVFNTSTQKIKALQDQYNEQEFIDETLKNEQLILSIKQNSEKAGEQIDKIIQDYKQLLVGKTQILESLTQNNKMKEEQVLKMSTLQQKLKLIFEKINQQKKIYLEENKKMAEQLIQVKELLTKAMGG